MAYRTIATRTGAFDMTQRTAEAASIAVTLKSPLDFLLQGSTESGAEKVKRGSYWWKRHTPLASQALDQTFANSKETFALGKWVEFPYDPAADLARLTTLRMEAKAIGVAGTSAIASSTFPDTITEPYYIRNAAFHLIETVEFWIGTQVIQSLPGWVNQASLDLRTPAGRRLYESVNGWVSVEDLVRYSRRNAIWYVPVDFYWTRQTSSPNRIMNTEATTKMRLLTRAIADIIEVPSGKTIADVKVRDNAAPTLEEDDDLNSNDHLGAAVGNTTVTVMNATEYAYVETTEHDQMEANPMCDIMEEEVTREYVYEYPAAIATGAYGADKEFRMDVKVPGSVKFLLIQVLRESDLGQAASFPGVTDPVTEREVDPINYLAMTLNDSIKIVADPQFFRLAQPYQYHTSLPSGFYYVFSFALDPEELKVTGSLATGSLYEFSLVAGLKGMLFTNDNKNVVVRVCMKRPNLIGFNDQACTKAFNAPLM